MAKRKRSFIEVLVAQWPGFLGLASIGMGLLIVKDMHDAGRTPGRSGMAFIGIGIALLGYWALANKNDDYNF